MLNVLLCEPSNFRFGSRSVDPFLESRRWRLPKRTLYQIVFAHYNSIGWFRLFIFSWFPSRNPQGEVLFRSEFSPALRGMLAGTEVDRARPIHVHMDEISLCEGQSSVLDIRS